MSEKMFTVILLVVLVKYCIVAQEIYPITIPPTTTTTTLATTTTIGAPSISMSTDAAGLLTSSTTTTTLAPPIVVPNEVFPIKVGHLASDGLEIDVLKVVIDEVLADVAVDPRLQFNITSRIVQCGNGRSVAVVAEMHYTTHADAVIGPSCPDDLDCAAKLAGIWNMPIISYTSSVSDIANSEKFPTLVSVSTTTGNSLSDALVAIFYGFKWTKAVIIYNIENTNVVNQVTYLLKQFTAIQVQTITIQLLTNSTDDTFASKVDLINIRSTTRIVILMMGDSLASNAQALRYLRNNGISAPEYVIMLPWLLPTPGEQMPWLETNGTIDLNVYKDYANTFVLDSDRKITNITDRFSRRLQKSLFLTSTIAYKYTTLYDAFKLYVLAVNMTLNQTDVDAAQGVRNGSMVYENMAGMSYEGASGFVQMDGYGERIPNYAIYVINTTNGSIGLESVADIDPKRVSCNSSTSSSTSTTTTTTSMPLDSLDCYMLEIKTDAEFDAFWQDVFSKVKDPPCGFDGSKCDNSKWYIVSGAVSLILVGGLVIGFVRRHEKQKSLAQMPWRVPIERVQVLEPSENRANSFKTGTDTSSNTTALLQGTKGIYLNTMVKIGRYKQLKNISFDQVEAQLLLSVKQLVHDNINPFLGLCYNNSSNELLIMWKYCYRGSLSRYLHNVEMHMDIHFKTAFIRDIINGLDYLHNALIGYHGRLNTNNCVIDANFIVKITPVDLDDLLEDWKASGYITPYTSDNDPPPPQYNVQNSQRDLEGLNEEALFVAPEFLRKAPPPRTKLARMGKSEQLRIKNQCRSADIYSLSICIYEILFRQQPFAEINLPIQAIINVIRNPARDQMRPKIPKILNKDHHPVILNLMQACWNEDPVIRPPIKRIKKIFNSVYKMKGSLVDSIIAIMDQHANSLEKQVKERTRMLEEAQLRADRLLAQMIPKDIARDLKLGKPVVPRAFASASVLFTDIVSFTTICSRSTPMEIVNFLNDLFTGYDAIISQMEAYKVETIGDAYLVCSGVPVENGTNHVSVIAMIALKMRKYLVDYKLPHMPEHKMEARWGLHSGPLAAGVVGLIAPRYCLFGDTVNVASRMESTGKPGKIQASSEFQSLIMQRDDPFIMEKRGTIHVKGKGEAVTYWLVDQRLPPANTQ